MRSRMTDMGDQHPSPAAPAGPTNVALCIEAEVYRRLRPSLHHLCVGLIDHNVSGRLVTRSAEVGRLSIGPIQMAVYEQPPWPLRRLRSPRRHRMEAFVEKMTDPPPTVVHAMSADAYEIASVLAKRFDVDFVVQVTSFRDIKALTPALADRADCLIAASQPLLDGLESALASPKEPGGPGPNVLHPPRRPSDDLMHRGVPARIRHSRPAARGSHAPPAQTRVPPFPHRRRPARDRIAAPCQCSGTLGNGHLLSSIHWAGSHHDRRRHLRTAPPG